MIAKPSIAFNDFSGTAKEVTARSVDGRSILSLRAKQDKAYTPSQLSVRNTLSSISRAYKQLTESQLKAWETLAGQMKGASLFGVTAEMTGHNAFVRLNRNRVMLSLSLLDDAPEYRSDIPQVTFDRVWITSSNMVIKGLSAPESSSRLAVRMSSGLSQGVSSGWNKTVIVSPGSQEDWGDADVTTLYLSTFGFQPAAGERVFIEMYWVDPETGFTGEKTSIYRTTITDEEAEEEGFVKRNLLTKDDLVDSGSVTDFQFEISTASNVIDLKITGTAPGNMQLNRAPSLPDRTCFVMLGRGYHEDEEKPTLVTYLGTLRKDDSENVIQKIHMGGYSECAPIDFFGPALLFN